ncbi:acyltransferase family protein [Stutzerimonas zhaodongensis]|uniref:acyltransferase family protein n=1 Tax=Stutzerimonas zhaodongensis TaxID=1176257 RepID=UPI00210779CC|nr:acyltransferase [Stutzerimonas zhaodongensis]
MRNIERLAAAQRPTPWWHFAGDKAGQCVGQVSKEKFIGLEWLRFSLGMYIVCFHTLHNYAEEYLPGWLADMTGVGFFATSSFFVLSGFLLAHVYCQQGQLREPGRSFLSRRFANLYPLHLFSLALTGVVLFIIAKLGIPPDDVKATLRFVVYDTNEDLGDASREALEHYMGNGELLLNFVLQLLMLQAWNPYYLTFNPPLWSISTLFFFYLTFPLLAPRLMNLRHKGLWLGVIMVIYLLPPLWAVLQQEYGTPITGMLHRMPLLRLPEFLGGILLYGLFRDMQIQERVPRLGGRLLMASFVLGCFVAAIWLLKGEKYWYFLLHNGLLLPSQLALIYLFALISTPASTGLNRWSQRLGAASLPLFVLHVPVFILFSRSEKLLGVFSPGCINAWSECATQAGEQSLSLWFYPIYLLLTVAICLWAQEHAVVPTRKRLLRWLPVQPKSA